MHVLKYVETGTGREIEFEPYQAKRFAVKPLDFTQLISAAGSERPSFPVRISNAAAISGETGLESGVPLVIAATIENNELLIAYGLVDGG